MQGAGLWSSRIGVEISSLRGRMSSLVLGGDLTQEQQRQKCEALESVKSLSGPLVLADALDSAEAGSSLHVKFRSGGVY